LAGFLADVMKLNDLRGCAYYEPYAGGAGAALSLLLDDVVSKIFINDADGRVNAFWASVLDESERFVDRVLTAPLTMEEWYRQREVYFPHKPLIVTKENGNTKKGGAPLNLSYCRAIPLSPSFPHSFRPAPNPLASFRPQTHIKVKESALNNGTFHPCISCPIPNLVAGFVSLPFHKGLNNGIFVSFATSSQSSLCHQRKLATIRAIRVSPFRPSLLVNFPSGRATSRRGTTPGCRVPATRYARPPTCQSRGCS
jgi:hypothetical protein